MSCFSFDLLKTCGGNFTISTKKIITNIKQFQYAVVDCDSQKYIWKNIEDYDYDKNQSHIFVKNVLRQEGEKYQLKMLAEIDNGEEWELICNDIFAFGENFKCIFFQILS